MLLLTTDITYRVIHRRFLSFFILCFFFCFGPVTFLRRILALKHGNTCTSFAWIQPSTTTVDG